MSYLHILTDSTLLIFFRHVMQADTLPGMFFLLVYLFPPKTRSPLAEASLKLSYLMKASPELILLLGLYTGMCTLPNS